jgi:hypothetical protein
VGVAVLLGVSIAVAARSDVFGAPRGSRISETRSAIRTVEQALVHWQADNATANCPADAATLASENYLVHAPRDAWGHPLRFDCPGQHNRDGADVSSAGPDGVFGTADDLRSWEL